ncbi:MAG: AraC family transcriptional regulator [Proteobacteria bacterium]|nr:AraC family transcriptional regulator [Pseudomonadota bacterium]
MAKTLQDLSPHPVRSLLPALGVMTELGFDRQVCLKGTGILLSQLGDSNARMSLQQELGFYRNALKLSDDPAVGLKLGEPYLPQRYGLFGYAMLSAATFRHVLTLAENFGRLTFSFFTFKHGVSGRLAWFSMSEPPPFENELIDLYLDRDMSAAVVDFRAILGGPFPIEEVYITHDGYNRQQDYRDYYDCAVHFRADSNKLVFSSALLDEPLPQSDPDSTHHFQQQCELLIAKLTTQGHFVDDVRMLMLSRPGFYPDIDYIAEKLGMSTRTLRRRLKEEGSNYRALLDEIRFGLAKEYLGQTKLPMEEICGLLGYSEPGTFSHAFRRWSGQSPRDWRLHSS